MTTTWRHLPAPAREIARAATDAVAAARARDPEAYDEAADRLAATDRSGLVLGAVVRLLLEETHPDGLDGDDVRQVLESCVRGAASWQLDVDPHLVLVLLAGALGVYDPSDDATPPDPATLARHAPLLLADLLAATGQPMSAKGQPVSGTDRPLDGLLTAAFAEIRRTELND
ncbi:hypothetical protein [Micromonospora sp. ATCC 39149]|uniref:Uncharacterized protein n=1 Tax=Micromonospora carbonacea TaxID=47853 RepID=A0A7D6C5S8_9ACTN|nr:hypothetical protein [Micromonospora sp. ATCC 39149]QLJ98346.1 hypothetical protein HZU44_27170 [Micromonospora carbonacea]